MMSASSLQLNGTLGPLPRIPNCCHEHATDRLLSGGLPDGWPRTVACGWHEGREAVVEVYAERVAGIDSGKAELKACVRVPGRRAGTFRHEVRTFGTTTKALLKLQDWLL